MNRLDLLEEDGRHSLRGIPTSSLANKTVLVTGASGLVGTHFLYGLLHCQRELGLRLKAVAVVQRGVPDHLKQLEQQGYVRFLVGDMAETAFLERLPPAHIIIHAATYGQPGLFMENALATLKLNTKAIFALFEKLSPGGQFLFLSSSEVYSGLTNPPYSEDQIGTTNTMHPRSCYIEAKRCGEVICNAYRNKGIDAKSARLCLAYGPGTRPADKRVINSFIEKALLEKVILLLDQGEADRTYCYIADAVHMMWRILLEGTAAVYNVGGISSTTIVRLAQLIGKLLDVSVHIPPGTQTGMVGAPDNVRVDLTKFINEFGPIALDDLPTGVARTIEWQRGLYIDAK